MMGSENYRSILNILSVVSRRASGQTPDGEVPLAHFPNCGTYPINQLIPAFYP
jgi:hypothetical protein